MSKFKKGDLIVERGKIETLYSVTAAPGEVLFMFGGRVIRVYLIRRTTPDAALLCLPAKELESDFIPLLEAYSSNPPVAHRP